jgi:general secretion pathway protein E
MVGEVRDRDTADIAIRASLTGHLVFTTLHTNDAPGAITRLVDMGIEPFLVATSVRAVQAQRLVRRVCPDCSRPTNVLPAIARLAEAALPADAAAAAADWREAVGCQRCQGTGYRGRLGIYELVDVTPELQELVLARATAERMRALASSQGGRTLREDGLLKARAGLTTVEEVVRVTGGMAAEG